MASKLLEVCAARSGYGQLEILKSISFDVEAGEVMTLIGSNGAGKTTTLNTVCGLVPLKGGEIRFEGKRIDHLPTQKRVALGIVQVPEGRRLFSELTILENLKLGAFLRNDKAGIAEDIEKMFAIFPRLAERKGQLAGSLSGGEQQMCAIARGLMARPRLLLLDEPSLGLAPIIVRQIFQIVKEINQQGVSILLVEQNAHMALGVAHRGHVLSVGHIQFSGTGRELLEDENVKRCYLGEI